MPGVAMSRPSSDHPTELELQILKILWDQSPRTVREVRDALAQQGRDLAHTSVITTLGTMVQKGQLQKLPPQEGKAFRFSPLLAQDDVSSGMLGDLVTRVFDGSAEALMLSLLDVTELEEHELARLRKLLGKKLREAKS
jgi:BlaI family penicillinase repressor